MELSREAQEAASRLGDVIGGFPPGESPGKSGIRPNDIGDIIGAQGPCNLYPSDYRADCAYVAFFVSLTGPYAKGSKHLKFRDALDKIFEHMQGWCRNITNHAIFITDSWEPRTIDLFRSRFRALQDDGKRIEIVLLGTSGFTPVPIP